MTLGEALKMLSDDERQQVEEKLQILAESSALGYQAESNLRNETRLPEKAWEALFEALQAAELNPAAIKEAITKCFQRWTLRGPELPTPHPTVFGRAVTMEYFCRLLVDADYFGSVRAAWRTVRNALSKPGEVVGRRWRRCNLGRHSMWSTFNPEKRGGNPFEGMSSSAKNIRGLLGLPSQRGRLLLLVYTLPPNVAPRFPTVAEAYAGSTWFLFFRPAPPGASHGMTMPWPEFQSEAPRPEVVHDVIRGEQLSTPLREVK